MLDPWDHAFLNVMALSPCMQVHTCMKVTFEPQQQRISQSSMIYSGVVPSRANHPALILHEKCRAAFCLAGNMSHSVASLLVSGDKQSILCTWPWLQATPFKWFK